MKIQIFINMLIRLLKAYQKAYDKKYSAEEMRSNRLHYGICARMCNFDFSVKSADTFNDYYYHLFKHEGYLFPRVGYNYENLVPRIEFLKSEIKRLEMLKGRGYTHV